MPVTIVIVGISGVGKSKLAHTISSSIPNVRHTQASQLLKDALKPQAEELRLGAVQDNQAALTNAFSKLRATTLDVILLDAHVLIDTTVGIEIIPEEVFRSFRPTAFIEVWDDPSAIVARRAQDTARIRPTRDENAIREHQRISGETVRKYTDLTEMRLVRIKSGDPETATEFVRSFLN